MPLLRTVTSVVASLPTTGSMRSVVQITLEWSAQLVCANTVDHSHGPILDMDAAALMDEKFDVDHLRARVSRKVLPKDRFEGK